MKLSIQQIRVIKTTTNILSIDLEVSIINHKKIKKEIKIGSIIRIQIQIKEKNERRKICGDI